jgi:hypothetical protein
MNKGINFLETPDALPGPESESCEPLISYEMPGSNKRRGKKPFIILMICFCVVILFLSLLTIGKFVTSALGAKESLLAAQEYALQFDFDNAKIEINDAQKHLHGAQSTLWIIKPLYYIPWVGDQVEALVVIVDTSVAIVDVLDDTLSVAGSVYESLQDAQNALDAVPGIDKSYSFSTLPSEVRVEMLRGLRDAAPDLVKARTEIELAQEKLIKIDDEQIIGSMRTVIDKFRDILPSMSSAIELITPFAQSVDELAGVDQGKQWLLLFLNNTEMRPGGGFMGVYGLMQIKDGNILDISTDNTYAIDELCESDDYSVNPPYPISTYLGLDTWYFRDANWSPDFAESSKTSAQLLRQEYSFAGLPVPQIDGVIGFTPTIVEKLIELTGDISVDGILFTSENFTETLEYQVEYGFKESGVAWEDRKKIINDLMDVLVDRLTQISIEDLPKVISIISDMFVQKQIALYSFDEQTQDVFEDADWAADINIHEDGDVLMIVDANMGALKTDHAIEKDITYSIIPVEDGFEAQVDIKYEHTGGFDWRTTRYQTYTSIMTPIGSELLYTNGANASQYEELGMTRIGSYFVVEPGKTGTLTFKYKLPDFIAEAIEEDVYKLSIIKQMGSQQAALTLDLDFGKKLRAALPSEDESQFGDHKYYLNTNLVQDSEVLVQF